MVGLEQAFAAAAEEYRPGDTQEEVTINSRHRAGEHPARCARFFSLLLLLFRLISSHRAGKDQDCERKIKNEPATNIMSKPEITAYLKTHMRLEQRRPRRAQKV